MDSNKSYKAVPEHRRVSGFLLGLVVVLSIFLVALEFTTHEDTYEAEKDLLDDLSQDNEMMPLIRRKDMIAATSAGSSSPSLERIRPVTDDTDLPDDDRTKDDEDVRTQAKSTDETTENSMPDSKTEEKTTALPPVAVDENDNPLDFKVVERLPEFPGGMVEFMKWLTKNLKYPALAQQQKLQGKVLVTFIINKDGTVTDPKVVSSAGPELDREALRVIRIMPKWHPGEDHGKPCRTYFRIPIIFKL